MGISEADTRKRLLALSVPGMVVGMVLSPVLLSISIIVTGIVAVLGFDRGLNPVWRTHFPAFVRGSLFWGLAGLYLYLIFLAPQTFDWAYFLERLRVKLPLLILPIAWVGIPFWYGTRNPGEHTRKGAPYLVIFVTVVVVGILINYAFHFDEINALIYRGQAMPVPRGNHIRFSLLVAIASVTGLDAWFRFRGKWMLWLGAALLVGLHVLAVRSGLAVGYAGWLIVAAGWSLHRRRYGWLIGGVVGILLLPVLAYLTLPSFATKMNYMRYELLHRDPAQDDLEYSDEGRWTSIRIGYEVWQEHPVLGVGPGNLRAVMDREYARRLPDTPGKRPHNQFVTALAGGGIVGFVLTVGCFLAIGFGAGRWRDPLFLAVWTMFVLSCLVENTLESSVGVSMFAFFLLLYGYPPYRNPGYSIMPPSM
ncbi:O-antigen ligase family protein [Lewinella sp. IMCC34191]|uniref:O-antigen ligase family protein n=1 Tax=Lewinella sp. IMCC34191 TaxID=2259172 RepID=UPI000E278BF3|nr:O-antigen ligase family protein [Lewinella sp. IMCC34191]